jgi:hypothetical protein
MAPKQIELCLILRLVGDEFVRTDGAEAKLRDSKAIPATPENCKALLIKYVASAAVPSKALHVVELVGYTLDLPTRNRNALLLLEHGGKPP